jgi:hypothetical protein
VPADNLDLSQGSVLHIKGFSSRGHPPKNKFCLVLGTSEPSTVLAFLISSQPQYRQQAAFCNELATIPKGGVQFLSQESFVQCFTLERLDADKLVEGFSRGSVENKGKLGKKYLYKVRDVVKNSKLLTQDEIGAVLTVLSLP